MLAFLARVFDDIVDGGPFPAEWTAATGTFLPKMPMVKSIDQFRIIVTDCCTQKLFARAIFDICEPSMQESNYSMPLFCAREECRHLSSSSF